MTTMTMTATATANKSMTDCAKDYKNENIYVFTLEGIVFNEKGAKVPKGMPCWKDNITKDNCHSFCHDRHRALAVMTGKISGITAVDFDVKEDGCAYEDVVRDFPELKNCRTIKTQSGGYHIYFKYDPEIGTTTNASIKYKHIDIRSDGAILFAPPTKVYKNAKVVGEYEMYIPGEIMEIPAGLKAALKQFQAPGKKISSFFNAPKVEETKKEEEQPQPQPQKLEEQPKINSHPEYITLLKDGIGNKGHSRDMWLKIVSWATAHLSQDIFLEFVDAQWRNETTKMWNDLLKSSKHFSCPVYLLEKYAKEINPEFYRKWRTEHKRYLKVGILDKGSNDVAQFIAPKLSQMLVYCDAKWFRFDKISCLWKTTTKPDATIVSHIQQEIDEARELLLYVKNKTETEEEKEKLRKVETSYLKYYRDVAVGSYCSQLKNYLAQYLCNDEFKNKLDQMKYRAAYADGILDLKTGEFRKGIKPDDYLTRKFDYNHNIPPQEDIDWVMNGFKKICNWNDAQLDYYLSIIGYAMTGDSNKEQNFFYLRGQTAENGKSVIFEALEKTAPIYVSKAVSTFLDEGADIKKEVASWRGLRILWVNELSQKKKNSELIKAICDGTFYKNNTNYAVVAELIAILFKLFCVSNFSPNIDADAGVKRRFILLQFMSQFKAEFKKDDPDKLQFVRDKEFQDKLTGKYRDAFMHIIFSYSKKYAKEGKLKPYPAEWQEQATETMEENDKFAEWFYSTFENVEGDVDGISKHEVESLLPILLKSANIRDNLKRLKVQFQYKSQDYKGSRKGVFYGFKQKIIVDDSVAVKP
jgi:hypothetical protein